MYLTPGFSGVDTLTYQTCNNDATCNLCDETIVIIHVDPQPEDCETFEANICVEPLQPETVCPTFCIDGSWHITSATAGYFTGCVIQVVDDCVTYTALPLQTGNDTITVIACSDANPTMCDTAYIYVHIGNCTAATCLRNMDNYFLYSSIRNKHHLLSILSLPVITPSQV
ncbi:MAG: hypothetical protein IPN94_23060 [Sphingobacteriales bacterium]|nr:hypothetical protein [Sphingobacteriales bacterium]